MANLFNFKVLTLGYFYDNVTTTQSCFLKDVLNLDNKNELSFRVFTSAEFKIELIELK